MWIRTCVRRLKSRENLFPHPSKVHYRNKERLELFKFFEFLLKSNVKKSKILPEMVFRQYELADDVSVLSFPQMLYHILHKHGLVDHEYVNASALQNYL